MSHSRVDSASPLSPEARVTHLSPIPHEEGIGKVVNELFTFRERCFHLEKEFEFMLSAREQELERQKSDAKTALVEVEIRSKKVVEEHREMRRIVGLGNIINPTPAQQSSIVLEDTLTTVVPLSGNAETPKKRKRSPRNKKSKVTDPNPTSEGSTNNNKPTTTPAGSSNLALKPATKPFNKQSLNNQTNKNRSSGPWINKPANKTTTPTSSNVVSASSTKQTSAQPAANNNKSNKGKAIWKNPSNNSSASMSTSNKPALNAAWKQRRAAKVNPKPAVNPAAKSSANLAPKITPKADKGKQPVRN